MFFITSKMAILTAPLPSHACIVYSSYGKHLCST